MKRMIVLILVLISFRISYAEELTTEQKQVAWKFIYENMLSKEYLPNIFKEDITVNLKGKITSEDSIVVKDIILGFQKAIPHLKINLSDKKGNLILGLNDGKDNRVTTNVSTDQGISSHEIFLPVDLAQVQRKKYIYYHLFRGLIFRTNTQKDVPGLNGCVYAEKDYQSITYSPLDLFILEKLYAPDFSIQLAKNLPHELQETAWNNIRLKILEVSRTPIIYKSDISIKLTGNVSQIDSIVMNKLVDQVKMIIPNRKISLTSGNGNLEVDFVDSLSGVSFGSSTQTFNNEIKYRKIAIKPYSSTPIENRKKELYYHLIRSLINFSQSENGNMTIPGSVFNEKLVENITCHPIDVFIVHKLYADDFQEQLKAQFPSNRLYLVYRYDNELHVVFFLLGWLLSAIFLIRLIINGAFKPHNWNWREYNKQGLYLIIIYSIYSLCISATDLQIHSREILLLLFLVIKALIGVNLLFLTERFILKNRHLGGSKVIVIFLITLVVMSIVLSWISISYWDSAGFTNSFTSKQPLNNILIIAIARSLYIFLHDRYKSILNQKDLELAQMSALHKQAELQSLRAKINPHFLYNALNSIASLATTDGRKTEQMALSLSDFFKYAINREQKQLNTLSEELNAIRTYLEIEKVRFGERLNFEIDCPTELLDIQIPQLLIQPLVENALKHGLSQITDKGIIKITITKANSQLKIRVYDNGPAFPEGPLTGFGIQNTQERIALIYGVNASMNWQNEPEKYIEISLLQINK